MPDAALADVPLGSAVTLLAHDPRMASDSRQPHDARLPSALRLAELGLRAGARCVVLSRTAGDGRIVAVGPARVALGRELTQRLRARVPTSP
ncbi:MAG: ferrous iron transport protein A [Actinomycetia bacterium]|nr:ferrous iron transport protein A [Actinomycetes bacterium]